MIRLPRTYYFSGGFITFKKINGVAVYRIYSVLPISEPILVKCGDFTGQDLAELSKPYILKEPYKTILGVDSK